MNIIRYSYSSYFHYSLQHWFELRRDGAGGFTVARAEQYLETKGEVEEGK